MYIYIYIYIYYIDTQKVGDSEFGHMQDSLAHPVASGQAAEGAVLLEQLPDHLMAQVPPPT